MLTLFKMALVLFVVYQVYTLISKEETNGTL